jgi:two-component system chemotaxis response regulator CheB
MNSETDVTHAILLADPDPVRRAHIMSRTAGGSVIAAASMSEAFDLAEAQRPGAIALSADITGDPGFDMFLHLVDALSITLIVYGDRSRDQTPHRLRKSIPFVPFGPGDHPERLFDGFFIDRGDLVRGHARPGDAPVVTATVAPRSPSLIVLGASTGGVSALETVLTAFPANCPPTLVVQHIRAGFVDGMITRLDGHCMPHVLPAQDALRLQPGHVYIAHDPDRHLIVQQGDPMRCRLKADPARHGHRPSVDALFESVAGRRGVAAALLTGMGADGADGLARIKQGGGMTIAQNEATCVVYGMPRVAVERGAADHVLALDRIATALISGTPPGGSAKPLPREMAK